MTFHDEAIKLLVALLSNLLLRRTWDTPTNCRQNLRRAINGQKASRVPISIQLNASVQLILHYHSPLLLG